MVDRDALARWPGPPYTCLQASSWDRGSVAPDKPGWFANTNFFGDLGTFWEAPFHAEPRWEGNRQPGFVTVTRTRSLDATSLLPFTPCWTPPHFWTTLTVMPHAGKKPSAASGTEAHLPFEEAMKQLESIVEAMEAGELPLEGLLEQYEAGARLVQVCKVKLAEAELRIQQLEQNSAGEMLLKPVALPATGE